MLRLFDREACLSRREWLALGGCAALGLASGSPAPAATTRVERSFGRAKRCIVLFLTGGPPQHETWDPKPDAPAEIRGEFQPIATSLPGLHVCELMPKTARLAHELCVL